MLPVGISQACGTLIGNAIGEASEAKAKVYYTTS